MIDQIAPRDYVASYFFFRLPQDTDNASVYSVLERGFHTTVQQVPELMYCVCKSKGARDELELRLHSDSGATITMKDFTFGGSDHRWMPGTFDDLERNHFPLQILPQEYVLAQTEFPGQACLPTLAMQANFIEGGLILTGCLHVCKAPEHFEIRSTNMRRSSILSVTALATFSFTLSLLNTSLPPHPAIYQILSPIQPSAFSIESVSLIPKWTSS